MDRKVKIILLSALAATAIWVVDSAFDAYVFHHGPLLSLLILDVPAREVYVRLSGMVVVLALGGVIAWQVGKLQTTESQLRRTSRVIKAIRQVNQLIARQKDPRLLIQASCESLIETEGYRNAWIVLGDQEGRLQTAAQAGLHGGFEDLLERFRQGELPTCWREATSRSGVWSSTDPNETCADCPLYGTYDDRGRLSARIEHAGKVFGVMTVSAPPDVVTSPTERSLLKEVAMDLGLALHDIEALKAREQALASLKESEANYRTIFQTAPNMIFSIGRDANITDCNDRLLVVLGRTREELLGRSAMDFVHPDDESRAREAMKRLSQAVPTYNRRYRVLCKDGSVVHISANTTARRNRKGEITDYLCIMDDITDRIRLEEQLRQAQKMEAIGRLAGGVAHDFRNQLTVIRGYCDLLRMGRTDPSELDETIGQIRNAADRAATITSQLLSFSRKEPLRPEVIDLNTVVRDLANPLARVIGEDIRLSIATTDAPASIKVDPNALQQTIMNLTINARDAMPAGGELWVEVALTDAPASRSPDGSAPPKQQVMLSVRDTGIGMDAGTIEHVFDPFFTTKSVGEGTGLGLSTVYGFVQQSDGRVEVESHKGHGSTFRVFFPPVESTDVIVAQPRSDQSVLTGAETILVVEDEQTVRQLITRILRNQGYTVIKAANPLEALPLIEHYEGTIDLLVTDVVMPHMSGPDLAKRLAKARPGVRVLYVSGYAASRTSAHEGLEDMRHLLNKPFSPEDLAKAVREMLDGRNNREPTTD